MPSVAITRQQAEGATATHIEVFLVLPVKGSRVSIKVEKQEHEWSLVELFFEKEGLGPEDMTFVGLWMKEIGEEVQSIQQGHAWRVYRNCGEVWEPIYDRLTENEANRLVHQQQQLYRTAVHRKEHAMSSFPHHPEIYTSRFTKD